MRKECHTMFLHMPRTSRKYFTIKHPISGQKGPEEKITDKVYNDKQQNSYLPVMQMKFVWKAFLRVQDDIL